MKFFFVFVLIFAVGLGSFLYSRTMPHLKDEVAFHAAYDRIAAYYEADPVKNDIPASRAYSELRKRSITLREPLKTYGLTAMSLGASGAMLFAFGFRGLRTPPSKWLLLGVAALAIVASVWGGTADIDEAFGRGDSPYWSNLDRAGVGIVIMYPILAAFAVFMTMALLVGKEFNQSAEIFTTDVRKVHPILATLFAIWAGLTVILIIDGGWYFSLLATSLWFYFYVSAIAIRAKGRSLLQQRKLENAG